MKMMCSLHYQPAQVVQLTELRKLFILFWQDLFSLAAEYLVIFLTALPFLLHVPDISYSLLYTASNIPHHMLSLKAFIIYPKPDTFQADYWQTESLGRLCTATSYWRSKVFLFWTGQSTQNQPLRNTARSICKMLANRMTYTEHQLASSKLTSPNNQFLCINNDIQLELKVSGDCFFAREHTNPILFGHSYLICGTSCIVIRSSYTFITCAKHETET